MSLYYDIKKKNQEDFNKFPIAYAFNKDQFEEGMKQLGLDPEDTDKVLSIGMGGFIKKTDKDAFTALLKNNDKRLKDAINGDKTGEGFIKDMFLYELANHEYGYTMDPESTFDALGFSYEEVMADPKLSNGYKLAREQYLKDFEDLY